MGHGRGQPDRLPLARPLARSPTRGEQGTRQVGRGHGTRATREDRPPVQPPPAWLPHPTPPRPHPLKRGGGAGGGRQKGTQTGGGTGKHEPAGTGTGGRGGARQGKAHNDDQAERPHRPGGTHAPRRGGQAQEEEEEGGRRGSNEKKNPAVAPRPPGAPPASPSLPPRNLTRVCGQDAPRPTGGWKPGAQPPGATPKPRGLGGTRHRAATARGEARGGGRTPRRPAGHHRGTHPRGAATRATRPRGEPPAPTGRGVVWGGARGAEGTPGGAADRGREPAGHRRHRRRRRVGGARQTGGGGGPDSTPRPISRGLPAARRGDSARRPHPTPGETHHAQKTACGARRLPKGRRRPRPTASARALWSVSSLSRAARAPPRPRSRRRPPPANPPHRPTRAPSSERAAGAGRGGGWGAGQIRQEAEGARQCLHLGGRRAHGGPARTPQPRHPRRGKHPGGGD